VERAETTARLFTTRLLFGGLSWFAPSFRGTREARDRLGVVLFLLVAPAIALGGWVGWMIYGKLSERRFQQMFAGLLVVSGLLLLTPGR
jgi:uncharacterized membrane protein YfcA